MEIYVRFDRTEKVGNDGFIDLEGATPQQLAAGLRRLADELDKTDGQVVLSADHADGETFIETGGV